MPISYFENVKRDDGYPITVEFELVPGSTHEVSLIDAWPNVPIYDEVYGRFQQTRVNWRRWWQLPAAWIVWPFFKLAILFWDWRANPSDVERERIEAWISEHHVYEPSEEDYF